MVSKNPVLLLAFTMLIGCESKNQQAVNETPTKIKSDSSLSQLLEVTEEPREPTKKNKSYRYSTFVMSNSYHRIFNPHHLFTH